MEEMTLEEIRKSDIEILDVIAKFCEERKINYWIDCGTLLGAIRHKGFIPWDDDIDVGMLRPDFDRFMNEFNGYNPKYKFYCFENNPKWTGVFGKVLCSDTIGTYVDVFIYDNAPDDDKALRKMFRKRDLLQRMLLIRLRKENPPAKGNIFRRFLVNAVRKIIKLVPVYYFVKKLDENSRRYISEDTKRVGNFSAWMASACDKSVFDSFIDVEFEGKKYKAPVGYDKWLRAFYGDYMQLPPVEQRVPKHSIKAYRKSSGGK